MNELKKIKKLIKSNQRKIDRINKKINKIEKGKKNNG